MALTRARTARAGAGAAAAASGFSVSDAGGSALVSHALHAL